MDKKLCLFTLCIFTLTIFNPTLLCESQEEAPTTKRRRRQKPSKPGRTSQKPIPDDQANPTLLNYEQEKQKDHEKMCNILGFASNIFGNFVQLVTEPKDQENVGAQVGNMAENVFHIVAEATKAKLSQTPDQETEQLLEYLESDEFRQDLQKIVSEILEQKNEENI